VLAQVALKGYLAHVLDDLAEGGKPVVAVRKGGTGLDHQPETTAVVLRKLRQRFSNLHAVNSGTGAE
jgi:hypothetical protein